MRTFTFKGLFLTALLGCLSIQAADADLITKQITIKLEEAGTLPNKIGSSKKNLITNLKIVGEINGTDWKMIREMAGRNCRGGVTSGNLSVLDLSEAKIVKGGDYYYDDNGYYYDDYGQNGYIYGYCYTSNDAIGRSAFRNCSGLTSINLPASITYIGRAAFEGCSRLTSINLPAGITEISSSTFEGCSGLTSINLPASITKIGYYSFKGCSGLTNINLPASITKICYGAFESCSGLTSLTLPSSISEIGTGAFSYCRGLKEVRFCINDNLDTYLTKGHPFIGVACGIKYYINDKEITSIEIPSNVTTLGQYVFQGCREFTSLTLPSSITEIGTGAFSGCSGLTSLNLPAGITEIGSSAFSYCSGLTSINLPAGITEIGSSAFEGCSGLTSINLPDGITSIGDYAFRDCSGLTSIYVYAEKVPKIGSDVFYYVDKKNCTLYVPQGTETDYFLANVWGEFINIVEFDATGIDKTTTSTDVKEVSRYSVNGQRLVGPTKGLNIVKYSDGSVKKVAVE